MARVEDFPVGANVEIIETGHRGRVVSKQRARRGRAESHKGAVFLILEHDLNKAIKDHYIAVPPDALRRL